MRTTGIIRRIDELGRVVIPKEIRRTMRLKVGEEMEIYSEGESLVLKKFSTIGHLEDYAKNYAEALANAMGNCTVLISDNDRIISASGELKKNYLNKDILPNINKIYAERTIRTFLAEDTISISGEENTSRQQIFAPIVSNGDIIGGIVIISNDEDSNKNILIKLIEVAAQFLGSIL